METKKKDGNIGDASAAIDERNSEQAKLHARLPWLPSISEKPKMI